ncbi:MAG: hypothetical protein WDN06_00795 [Asticcacaulis sp.]
MSAKALLKAAIFIAIGACIAAPVVWSQTAPPAAPPATTQAQDAIAASPPRAAAAAKLPGTAQLWQVTVQTTVAGQTPATKSLSLCTGPDDLKTPPVPLTGPQCPQPDLRQRRRHHDLDSRLRDRQGQRQPDRFQRQPVAGRRRDGHARQRHDPRHRRGHRNMQ